KFKQLLRNSFNRRDQSKVDWKALIMETSFINKEETFIDSELSYEYSAVPQLTVSNAVLKSWSVSVSLPKENKMFFTGPPLGLRLKYNNKCFDSVQWKIEHIEAKSSANQSLLFQGDIIRAINGE